MILVFWCVPHAWSKGSDLFAWCIKYIVYLYTCSDIFTTSSRKVCSWGHVHNCLQIQMFPWVPNAELYLMSMIHTVNYVRFSNFPFLSRKWASKINSSMINLLIFTCSFLLSCKLELHFYVPALLQGNHQNWAPLVSL